VRCSALNHPNILTIHEVGSDEERHFIATEYIDGTTLRRKISGAPMDAAEILDIAVQVASAWKRRTRQASFTGTSSPTTYDPP